MTNPASSVSASRELLIFSQRNLNDNVSRCSGFEFEDMIADVEDAEIVAPRWRRDRKTLRDPKRWLSKRTNLFQYWPSGARKTHIKKKYDMGFFNFQKIQEVLTIDAVPNWRERCDLAICTLEEVWPRELVRHQRLVSSLAKFDLITCAFAETCEPLARATGKPVIHSPGAADLVRFAPQSLSVHRPIDVYYMGRKRQELHERLLLSLKERAGFYLYDSATKPPITSQHVVHRELLANLVQHTKLFIVDIAKIGHEDQEAGNVAWGPRHVEGIAGGAVQVGYAPETDDYLRYFDWPESVFRLQEDPDEAVEQILFLLDDLVEQDRIRKINLTRALQKHDWLHRWAQILDYMSIPESEAMKLRRQRLSEIVRALELDCN